MIKYLEPCSGEIPDKVTIKEIEGFVKHLLEEADESMEAFVEYGKSRKGRELQHLGEELADVITMAYTTLNAIEQMDGVPTGFAELSMQQVWCKNHCRGYHG